MITIFHLGIFLFKSVNRVTFYKSNDKAMIKKIDESNKATATVCKQEVYFLDFCWINNIFGLIHVWSTQYCTPSITDVYITRRSEYSRYSGALRVQCSDTGTCTQKLL